MFCFVKIFYERERDEYTISFIKRRPVISPSIQLKVLTLVISASQFVSIKIWVRIPFQIGRK